MTKWYIFIQLNMGKSVKYIIKDDKCYTFIGHLSRMELVGLEVAQYEREVKVKS